MRRREFMSLIGAAAAFPVLARAQDRLPSVAVLTGNVPGDTGAQMRVDAFQQGLADRGWIANQNYRLEVRWPGPSPARQQVEARELIAGAPDVLLSTSTGTTRALRDATQNIPIIFVGLSDPVGTGLVVNLARPTDNLTGFSLYEHSMSGKWLSLLKDMAPGMTSAALLFNPDSSPYAPFYLQAAHQMESRLGLQVTGASVRSGPEIAAVIEAAARSGGGLVVLPDGGFFGPQSQMAIALLAQRRVPAIFAVRFYAVNGGLMSYGADLTQQFRDGAGYVDRVLRGAEIRTLPVQFATRFELVINMKTTHALGLTVPNRLLLDAELIE
ncbi:MULTISPECIES: ABC transporter substrate-binding protein [Bradyrhizobium]|uniref:ABC transporter substrate-binding protein n=1 Tax=Bradyrhizobium arachidis TaxID=858423 RepID=A0AAE7NLA5_9BRAD|nr:MULTISPECIES: ABC transporter substrate-binding protein [Bradyrhizobium]QOZ68039.1 ABC transporter substrate-binding protein [Bradyrhizobium arachidis]UFW52694.1 ABC transporter substrate-binding protein [Bradyrhizobium arachidis]SFV13213.1 putative ABC transport system substrate-binding protein [Bradyrhizobium arachidis]